MLDVAGRDVLVVGGGVVAARRAATLVEAGAHVTVVAPALAVGLRARLEDDGMTWVARTAVDGDCAGRFLVVIATDDDDANARVAAEARAAGALVNDATDSGRGDVLLAATVRRGALTVAVSTGGASPACTAFVRRLLDERLEPELGRLTELAARLRELGVEGGVDTVTREALAADLLPRLLTLLREGRGTDADQLVEARGGAQGIAILERPAWS